MLPASFASKPAIACSRIAQSSTVRAIGPQWSNVNELGMTPARLTRPDVGISPESPQNDEGPRIEPPVSDPSDAGTMPAASAAPEPLDEPPVKCSRCHGLRDGGHGRSNDGPPCANSCVCSLPSNTMPASSRRRVVVASADGTLSLQTLEPPDVRIPLVL